MLVAHYPYPTSGVHTAYYNGGYSHITEAHNRGGPSFSGPHFGGPVPRPSNVGQVSGPHSGVPMSSSHTRDQLDVPINGASPAGFHNGVLVSNSPNLGRYPNHSNESLQADVQSGQLVPEYLGAPPITGSQCAGPSPTYSNTLCCPPQPPAGVEQGAARYMDPRGQSFLGPQYHSYGPDQEASQGYERQLCRPTHPLPQNQIYPGGRDGVPYPGYLHHHQQQCEAQEEKITPKVEPDSNMWQEDLLSHFQHVRLQSDGTPPPRDSSKPRRKRRTSEKRKENSRVAARCRRDKESKLFDELAGELPLPSQTITQLDKASVMRLTNSVLKTRLLCQAGFLKTSERKGSKLDLEMDGLLMKALDGFLLALSTDGDIVYTSENIVAFLGLQQVDVMGQSLFEYTHPCDHDEVRDLMLTKSSSETRHAFLRFKCTLTAKGRSVNLKSASYKVVQVSGELVGKKEEQLWLVALATPVPHPSNIEFPLNKQTFVSRHSLDMKFTYVDDNVEGFCGYVAEELVGRSLYEMHHALDSELVKDAYKTLRNKGQVETGRYRFLARGGGYVWLVTQATLIHGPKDHKPQYVVCLNYVISGIESIGEILSELQLLCNTNDSSSDTNKANKKASPAPVAAPPVVKDLATPTPPLTRPHTHPKVCDGVGVPGPRVTPALPPRPPVATTFKIFAPRTKDMNKGYLIFSEDDPQCTVLKEEPEDLTHLAPSEGDTCVPLIEVAPLNTGLDDDQCMRQEVSTLSPNLDDMFTLDYQMPNANSDVLIASPVPDKADDLDSSPKYLYDESHLTEGDKCMNSLSGGHLVLRRSACSSPSQDCSNQHPGGLGTPEPPKPLLSEAALPLPHRKQHTVVFGGSRPRTTTESFFTHLDESRSQGSTSELFGKLDLKPEDQSMDSDEFEMRAPYIPFSNEDLLLGPDDLLWGAEPEPSIAPKHSATSSREGRCCGGLGEKEDSSLAQLLRDTDPPITGGPARNLHLDNSPGTQRNQYHQSQSKFLDGGGNFVDPNKVLPGHFAGKEEVESGGGRSQLMDPPPALVQETVEPPPPLLSLDAHQVSVSVKRGRSPLSSPTLTHKKLCSPSCQPESSPHQGEAGVGKQGGVRLLTTPYAPTMQQLLVSKEPITVRGGRPGGGLSASRNSVPDENHSVLRNLLNVPGESNIVLSEGQGGGLSPSPCLHVARDKMATMVVTGGGGGRLGGQLSYPKLRLVTGAGTIVPEGHVAFKLASSSSMTGGESAIVGRRSHRQDPLLLMSPDTTIPNLLDLTQQDYEVNAPANNCSLLQGADLLMALDQSL